MSATVICRGCYEEVHSKNNAELRCSKCGTINNFAENQKEQQSLPSPPTRRIKRQREPLAPVENLLVILACLALAGALLTWFGTDKKEESFLMVPLYFGVACVAMLVYFAPAIIGKHKKNAIAILVLNAFLGWTFLGWVVALVWATTRD